MENLTANLWYATYLDNPFNATPCVDVAKLADALPHGSGIDSDWHVTIRKNGNVHVTSQFHNHGEHGYAGWVSFSFRIYRARRDKLHPLKGPMAGKVQVTARKGDIQFSLSCRGELGDYLHETIYFALQEAGILPESRSEIVDAD
jgi:hypothetical protein